MRAGVLGVLGAFVVAAVIVLVVLATRKAPLPPVVDASPTPDASVADAALAVEPIDAAPPEPEHLAQQDASPDGGVHLVERSAPQPQPQPPPHPPPLPRPPPLPPPVAPGGEGHVTLGPVVMTPSRPGGIEAVRRVVGALRPRLSACYTHALAANPTETGRLLIRCRALPSGEVASADAVSSSVSPALADCSRRVLRGATLPASDVESFVALPISFEPP